MKYLIFDIETVPNEETGWTPPDDRPTAFPPIPAHKVVSIGGMLLSLDIIGYRFSGNDVPWLGNFGDHQEGESSYILEFLEMIEEHTPTLVSYNGRGFDLPVIEHRCMRYGIKCAPLFEWNLRNRFKEKGHIDLQDMLTNFGASMRSQLGVVCASIGMPGKMDVDGGKVKELIARGEQETVDSYCLCDIGETAWLLVRWLHMKGEISDTTNHNAIHAIRSALLDRQDEMLDKLVKLTNIRRLSLEERDDQLAEARQNGVSGEDDENDTDIPF